MPPLGKQHFPVVALLSNQQIRRNLEAMGCTQADGLEPNNIGSLSM